jgi:hypothetical protein
MVTPNPSPDTAARPWCHYCRCYGCPHTAPMIAERDARYLQTKWRMMIVRCFGKLWMSVRYGTSIPCLVCGATVTREVFGRHAAWHRDLEDKR